MSEWKEYKLGDAYDFSSGLSKSADQFGYGYEFLTFKEVFHNFFLPTELSSLVNSNLKERETCSIKQGDVFLTRTSETDEELGMSSVALKDYPNATFNGFTKRLRPNGKIKIYPEFIAYYLRSPKFRSHIVGMSSITTRASLNNSMLSSLPLIIPTYEEQKEIGNILKSLDDKIDLLNRENKTLEAMAETLFRKWFIEDAKEDWEEKTLLDCIELVGGGTPKTCEENNWNGDIYWLSGGDIAKNHKGYVIRSEKMISQKGLNNSSAKLLPMNSIVISARGTVGKYCLLSKPMAFSQSNYGILPKFSGCFFFTFLLIAYYVDELQSTAYGSVFDTITTNTFKGITVSLPNVIHIQSFEEQVKIYFTKIKLNACQIQTLMQIRDILLFKLISRGI
jgi:type I restriction enzyme S subunit